MTHPDVDLDHLARELSGHLRTAMTHGRRAASAVSRTRATTALARTADGPGDQELAATHRLEHLAARWATADLLRDRDPVTAQAWDARVAAAGVDPATILSTNLNTDKPTAGRDTAPGGPSEVVVEHLTTVYSEQAVHEGTAAPASAAPTVGELLDQAHPDALTAGTRFTRGADTSAADASFTTARTMDQGPRQGQRTGVDVEAGR